MKRILLMGTLLLLLLQSPLACLWDYDTLRVEASGKMDIVHVLTGRFERWPDRYYEMRLEHVTRELDQGGLSLEERLDRLDNAAVALDRLKRSDEAVVMIERKRALLEAEDPTKTKQEDHWYRFYANAGTLYAHRWFAQGATREKMADLERGRDLIRKAIELNPGAHFGREDVQLAIMEWMVEDPQVDLGGYLDSYNEGRISSERARKGLVGLVMLGNAWESVDVFQAIGHISALQLGEGAVAELANERARELLRAGKKSLLATDEEPAIRTTLSGPKRVRAEYLELRADADAWAKEREAFVLKRLGEGKHPDTDQDFWEGYMERPPRPLDADSLEDILNRVINRHPEIAIFGLAGTLSVIVIAVYVRRRKRVARRG